MAELPFVRAAARNNAEWCDTFCRAHGIVGSFSADCWTSAERTPPLYPDAVSLSPGVAPMALLAKIDAREGCSVKDSFADLDLAAHGFEVLFRAEWLLREKREASAAMPVGWVTVETREQLEDWESAWGAAPEQRSFFQPALLANSAIAVLARYDGERIVAGAVTNRSAEVVGISNVFDPRGDLGSVWVEAAEAAQARWGPGPLVAYDSGPSLEAAHKAGFAGIGELVVWVKPAAA
jgi:hypothetical protein